MAIIRSPHEHDFVIINKICLQDKRLPWKSKGIYTYVMALPDNWKVKTSEVVKHSTDGRTALMSGIKELMKFGYCVLIKNRNLDGTIKDYDYCFKEPTGISNIVNNHPILENQLLDNQIPDNLSMENQVALLSIDRSNIDSSKKLDKTIVLSSEDKNVDKKAAKKKGKKKKTPRKFHPNSLGGKLAQFMLDKIEKNDPSFKTPEMGSWEACFNRMIFLEHYDKNEIKKVISFALSDNFWKAIALKPFIIRAKYYEIKTRMLNPLKPFKNKQTREEKRNVFEEAKKDYNK